jgi:hypothetical protein
MTVDSVQLGSSLPAASSLPSSLAVPLSEPEMPPESSSSDSNPERSAPSPPSLTEQTIQEYLNATTTQEIQTVQNHLESILPGMVDTAVGTHVQELAQTINNKISSIESQVLRSNDNGDASDGDDEDESEANQPRRDRARARKPSNTLLTVSDILPSFISAESSQMQSALRAFL